jgi:hypothetical protein
MDSPWGVGQQRKEKNSALLRVRRFTSASVRSILAIACSAQKISLLPFEQNEHQ